MERSSQKKNKSTLRHGQQCADYGKEEWVKVEEGIRGINGNEKNAITMSK